jgi:hypothetical protein
MYGYIWKWKIIATQKNKGKPLFGPGNMRYITVFPFAGPGRNGGAILMSHLER